MMSGSGDPLFLQFKEARPSVLEPYEGQLPIKHHGERVVIGQRLMQSASDIFLGWFTGSGAGIASSTCASCATPRSPRPRRRSTPPA